MIRMIQSISATGAKDYFNEALSKSDYYLNDQELNGSFQGRIADRIGIKGNATKEIFHALCENIHPISGNKLTARKADRRTIGYDINFHCPKSVSVLHVLSKDNHILDAFQNSVTEIMTDIESDSKARLRKNGKNEDRDTGELLWADFIHQTARPVKDAPPDPHLHCHCFTFNVTWDDIEKQYKAGQFRDVKRDMPYYQAKFQKNLSDKLMQLGYGIRKTETAFEVEGVPENVIKLFSKRTNEIGQLAKENNITDAKELDQLGSRTRAQKQKGLTMTQLKGNWRRQIKELGMDGNKANGIIIRNNPGRTSLRETAKKSVDHALEHCFERVSVMQDRRILEKAYLFSIGADSVSVQNITDTFNSDKRLLRGGDGSRALCTTHDVITQEKSIIKLAKGGIGKFKPLYEIPPAMMLSNEQKMAVIHVLTSTDQVSIIQGRAGTGKTTLMKEAVELIEKTGKKVLVAAPTSEASRGVLRDEGFQNAETVAKLLSDPKMQDSLAGQVLWVDEAGLLGAKEMEALLYLASRKGARLILSGDIKQHSSVFRGDALRVLQELADIPAATVSTIYRQKNAQYREAVQSLSTGNVKTSFNLLDKLEAIKTPAAGKQSEAIAADYVASIKKGKSALAISPTHKQGEELTETIRQKLKEVDRLGKKEKRFKKLVNCNMTDAEKTDSRNFRKGHVLQFTQNMPGIKRGSAWSVDGVKGKELCLSNQQGDNILFAVERKKDFDVFIEKAIALSKGDSIRITRNGFDTNNKRLNNGQTLEVTSVDKKGKLWVRNKSSKAEYLLDEDFGHISHAYCVTSHASQGKTVDEVFIYQPSSTFQATDLKQFYVSVSRGREAVHIYTDDKQALLDHASEMRDRQSGLELIGFRKSHTAITKPISNNQISLKKIEPSLSLKM